MPLFFFGLFLYYILSFCCCCYVAQRQPGKMMENPRVADTEQIGRQRDVKGCKWTDRRQIVTRTKPHTFRPRHAQNTSVVRVSSQRGTHWWCTIVTKRNCGMLESNTISHILPWKLNANSYGDNILSDLPVANWFEFICKLNGWVDFFFLVCSIDVVVGCWWLLMVLIVSLWVYWYTGLSWYAWRISWVYVESRAALVESMGTISYECQAFI